jgi:hypothetical protein
MKTIAVLELALLLAASGCGDARGATLDAGTTFAYSSRQQVKCNTVMMPATATEVQAQCTSSDDLPLAGSCSNPGPGGANAVLGLNGPAGWEISSGAVPAWLCVWTVGGQAVNVPNGQATICCVVKTP